MNKRKKLMATLFILSTTLTGCFKNEPETTPTENYDVIDQTNEGFKTLKQELKVPGEKFKLITEYSCDNDAKRAWRITSDKFLYLKVYTKDLDPNFNVWIDNVHVDTSIKSKYAVMDGILQDTMDDRVHNSQMIGFPIGNHSHYYGVNAIEGSNETFIHGYTYGMSGYTYGEITERRRTESELVNEYGVWGNKIQVVYDLLVQGPNDKTPRNISVCSDFIVKVTNSPKKEKEESSISKQKETAFVYIKK